jgi:hypothetical protein
MTRVDYELGLARWNETDGTVPGKGIVWLLGDRLEDGTAEVIVDAPHASPHAIAVELGLEPLEVAGRIRKTTHSTAGFVVSEPHRQRPPAAEPVVVRESDRRYVSANE